MRTIDVDALIEMMEEKCDTTKFADVMVLMICKGAINSMPTVTQWIPCRERLPGEDGWYLCSYESRLVESALFYNGGWCDVNVDVNNVLAWMPLPEPYKEK